MKNSEPKTRATVPPCHITQQAKTTDATYVLK